MKLLILAFSPLTSIWWVPNTRPSCLLGRPVLSKAGVSAVSAPAHWESRAGQAGGQGRGVHLLPWL